MRKHCQKLLPQRFLCAKRVILMQMRQGTLCFLYRVGLKHGVLLNKLENNERSFNQNFFCTVVTIIKVNTKISRKKFHAVYTENTIINSFTVFVFIRTRRGKVLLTEYTTQENKTLINGGEDVLVL